MRACSTACLWSTSAACCPRCAPRSRKRSQRGARSSACAPTRAGSRRDCSVPRCGTAQPVKSIAEKGSPPPPLTTPAQVWRHAARALERRTRRPAAYDPGLLRQPFQVGGRWAGRQTGRRYRIDGPRAGMQLAVSNLLLFCGSASAKLSFFATHLSCCMCGAMLDGRGERMPVPALPPTPARPCPPLLQCHAGRPQRAHARQRAGGGRAHPPHLPGDFQRRAGGAGSHQVLHLAWCSD